MAPVTIKSRASWGARPPKYRGQLSTTHNGWFWHWLGVGYPEHMSDEQILQSVQRFHMGTRGWSDIAYSFAVGRDGGAYELRGWDVAGGHTKGYNNSSMAIVFLIGEGESPTPAMFRTAYGIMAQRPEIKKLRPHRAVGITACPGDEIAAEIDYPQYKDEVTMTPSEAEMAVAWAYGGILDRAPDDGGKKFWVNALVTGSHTEEDMRWEFVVVRLAADKAKLETVVDAGPGLVGPAVEAAGKRAYQMFLDDLVALQS